MSKPTPRAEYLEQQLRAKAWHDFLIRIDHCTNQPLLPFTTSPTIPPAYIHTDNDRWEYLREIAAGFVLIPGCGLVCRGKLAQFLRENAPCLPAQQQAGLSRQAENQEKETP